MKEHLISFACGFITIVIVASILYAITFLLGQEAMLLGLLLIVTWGVGSSIREAIRDRKGTNDY